MLALHTLERALFFAQKNTGSRFKNDTKRFLFCGDWLTILPWTRLKFWLVGGWPIRGIAQLTKFSLCIWRQIAIHMQPNAEWGIHFSLWSWERRFCVSYKYTHMQVHRWILWKVTIIKGNVKKSQFRGMSALHYWLVRQLTKLWFNAILSTVSEGLETPCGNNKLYTFLTLWWTKSENRC